MDWRVTRTDPPLGPFPSPGAARLFHGTTQAKGPHMLDFPSTAKVCSNGHVVLKLNSVKRCHECRLGQQSRRRKKVKVRAPWYFCLDRAKERSRKKQIPFDLTPEWAISRYTGKCELTGLPFVNGVKGFYPFSPSIDRIDSSKGYEQHNCRFILMAINVFKGRMADDEMMKIAMALVAARYRPLVP